MFKLITADERMARTRTAKMAIIGPPGVGKTSLLRTMDLATTLFVDLEAGDLSVQDLEVATIQPRTWQECRNLAVILGGPDASLPDHAAYSAAHHKAILGQTPAQEVEMLTGFKTLFIDSITQAGRLCFRWSQQQPEAVSERTGKPDVRGAYGLHAREMIGWLQHLQHIRDRNVVFVGILERNQDDFGRAVWDIQMEGAKTGKELPGIVDELLTMQFVQFEGDDKPSRVFVCQSDNPYGWPAKDRSGRLEMIEKPDLGEVLRKITQA